MGYTAIPVDTDKATLDALTSWYDPAKLIDNIFVKRPFWQYLRKSMLPIPVTGWTPEVELHTQSGTWYTRKGEMKADLEETFSEEIATKAKYEPKYFFRELVLPSQDVIGQSKHKLVDLVSAYTKNALKSTRTDMSESVFTRSEVTIGTGQGSNEMESLDQACWYGNTYGAIDPTDTYQETWEAHVMEGETESAVIVAVSPTFPNLHLVVRRIEHTTEEKPDLLVTTEDVWTALNAQISANQYAEAKQAVSGSDIVKWGFDALWVKGVPIVEDRDCYGEDFVADQASTVLAKGHDLYAINFDHFKLGYVQAGSFKWHEDGWKRTRGDYDAFTNIYYIWCTTGSDNRRSLGRIVNIDPTMASSEFVLGNVRLPGADA